MAAGPMQSRCRFPSLDRLGSSASIAASQSIPAPILTIRSHSIRAVRSRIGQSWLTWKPLVDRKVALSVIHLFMLRLWDARSMPSSSAFPIGSRHPDLAQPLQSRSYPLTASAETRFDRAKNPFQGLRYGGDFQPSFYYTSHADCDPNAPRDRVPASAAGPGFRSYFKIDPLAAHTGTHFSRPGQALRARDRLARRRYPPLDRAARGTGLISESSMGDWLVAASFAPQPGRYRSTAQCVHTVFDQGGSTEHGALDLMTKSRTFPGDFAW